MNAIEEYSIICGICLDIQYLKTIKYIHIIKYI